ncbi:hypothetical protein Cgig2_025432 [Carnegiea gigantea]|uniref:Uncharacterized protein n=1 Tax=Carnegiea gigantea TaxID=171969 RepID=A0A9Q1KQ53_9CARY|nr:hypothetical protein Cgig2_025432 [Carnegiea gigantea]
MGTEYENCKVLLVDKKIIKSWDLVNVLEDPTEANYLILTIAKDIEHQYRGNVIVLTGVTTIKDEVVGGGVLGHAARIVLTKENATVVGDGSTQEAITKGIAQTKSQLEVKFYTLPVVLVSFCYWYCQIEESSNLIQKTMVYRMLIMSMREKS